MTAALYLLGALAGATSTCPIHPVSIQYAVERLEHALCQGPSTEAVARRATGSDPGLFGQWQPPQSWDVIAIHAAMLPNGQVLHYSYPGGDSGSRARLWDPASGQFTNVDMNTDIFCSGLSFLPDGGLYVTGGNDYACDFMGRFVTNVFNPFTQQWTAQEPMATGRWYPTNTTLGDGRVMITSGLNTHCELTDIMEMLTPDGLIQVPEGNRLMELYPRLHLLTSGKVAHVGIENASYTFDPQTVEWAFVNNSNLGWRCNGTSVLVPGFADKIMIIGGDCPDTSSCEMIDFSSDEPHWEWTTSMNHPRAHADALILPDGTILVMGGGTGGLYDDPVNIPELFDPQTEQWQELPPHVYGRMYHATTLLLPDGRVLVAGQDLGDSMFFSEIYEPAYLFRGDRPEIEAVPPRIAYNQPFSLATPQANDITRVALIPPSTVTHSVNNNQRYVDLQFSAIDDDALSLSGPLSGNHAPPGYYMLFILDGNGVPAVAEFVQVGPWIAGDVDGNGDTDIEDLLALLAAWGPCAGCQADLDADGAVGITDILFLLSNWS